MRPIVWLLTGVVALATVDARHAGPAGPSPAAPAPSASGAGLPLPAIGRLGEAVQPGPDGALVIANAAYRATFSADDGVVYTPRHGKRLEPRLTWQYRARALVTDTTTRRLDAAEPAISATGEHVVDFSRPGLIERYEGERAGIEQIFIVPERPDGAGDLRIVGDVRFGGAVRTRDGGLEFDAGHGLPVFTYAKPVAFGVDGAPVPVRVEVSGEALSLVVDGDSLDRVRWPLTIDPLFGVAVVESSPFLGGSDIAYNPRRGEFAVAYGAWDANYDAVLRVRRYRDHGSPVGAAFTVHLQGFGFVHEPKLAYDVGTDRYLAVWMDQSDAFRVKGILLDGAAQPIGGVMAFTSGGESPCAVGPHVAARNLRDHAAADTTFLVVWREGCNGEPGEGIYRQRVAAAGTQFVTGKVSPGPAQYGAVAFDPHTDRFLVAYADGQTVAVRTVAGATGAHGSEVVLSTYGGRDVAIAYDVASRRALVVWEDGDPGALWGRLIGSGATPAPIGANFLVRQSAAGFLPPAITSEVGTFVVQQHQQGGTSGIVETQRFRADGLSLGTTLLDAAAAPAIYGGGGGGLASGFHGFTPATYLGGAAGDPRQMIGLVDRWYARYVHGGTGDFDGDGRSDLFLFQQATGTFTVKTQTQATPHVFAIPGAVPALLDWNGDGRGDLCVWEPATGTWWILETATGHAEQVTLGKAGDIPVPGDYLGSGRDQVAVFRPESATWRIKGSARVRPTQVVFGELGDVPVPADWNGDGDIELGVWRPSTGRWYAAELDGTPVPVPATPWGQAGDIPLAGNFTGSAVADQVVYRRQLGVIFRRDGATGATATIAIGGAGIPIPLDWDGDGYQEPALFDDTSGGWDINDAAGTWVTFGTIGDIPAGR